MGEWKPLLVFVLSAVLVAIAYFGWHVYQIPRILKLQERGVQFSRLGQLEESEDTLRKALMLAGAHWDEANTAHILINLASTLRLQERWEEAEQYAERALGLFRKHGDPNSTMVAVALDSLVEINAGQDNSEKSDIYFKELVDVLQEEETNPEQGNPYLRDSLREKVDDLLVTYYKANLSREDVDQLFDSAKSGDANAQFRLHELYMQGLSVEQDYVAALEWVRKSAAQGHTLAEFNLGLMYAHGLGVEQDFKEAVAWFRRAAEKENADAQYSLGISYVNGDGVPQDYTQAFKWFMLAADQGLAEAQWSMSVIYYEGQGVPSDQIESYAWCALSAASGNEQAMEACNTVLNSLSILQQGQAHQRAEKLFIKYGREYLYP